MQPKQPKYYGIIDYFESNEYYIICFNEIWFKNWHKIHFPSYYFYRADRQTGEHGGVAIAVKKEIIYSHIPSLNTWSGRYIETYMQYLEQMRLFHVYNFKWMFLFLSHSCFLMQSSLSPGPNSENFLLVTKWTIQNLLTKIPDFSNLFEVAVCVQRAVPKLRITSF